MPVIAARQSVQHSSVDVHKIRQMPDTGDNCWHMESPDPKSSVPQYLFHSDELHPVIHGYLITWIIPGHVRHEDGWKKTAVYIRLSGCL